MAKRSRSKARRGGSSVNTERTEESVAGNHVVEETAAASDKDASEAEVVEVNDAPHQEQQQQLPATPAYSKSETIWNTTQSHLINNLLPFVSSSSSVTQDEMLGSLILLLKKDGNSKDDADDTTNNGASSKKQAARQQLVATSAQLFRYMEHLADMEDQLKESMEKIKRKRLDEQSGDAEDENLEAHVEDDREIDQPCTLSGIPSLYTGEEEVDSAGMEPAVDAETIWGQVELQNNALMPRLKKMIKKLGKRADNEGGKYKDDEMVRILDTAEAPTMTDSEDDTSDGDDSDGGEDMSEGSAGSNFEEEDGDDDDDPEARRIRERMEAAMADMSDDDNDNESNNETQGTQNKGAEEEEDIGGVDPDRENMRDGFFDLHEMEAFADEEEEMLPQDAYGEESMPPNNEGDDDSEDEDDDDDDDEDGPLTKRFQSTTVRRKKYRADDEVEALYKLYDDDGQNDNDGFDSDSDDEKAEEDPMAMTAADLFGKPNEKLVRSYKSKKQSDKKKNGGGAKEAKIGNINNDDDADSWDNHNFEDDAMDWKDEGDNDDEEAGDSDEDPIGNKEDDEGEDTESQDDAPINDNEHKSSHATHSQKLQEQTIALEKDMLAEKPWAMMGEAKGTDRAQDSLLDGGGDGGPTPEFAVAFKPTPILTAEHTTNIEEMIKKRIIDEDWDDVIPRELPDIGKKRGDNDAPEVSQEKSKLGLGELYEREYLKKTSGYDRDAHEKQTTEDLAKEEMTTLFTNLCSQLDALSNYQFAPRPVAEETDVQQNKGSVIAMEEVLPLHVCQARGVAPEEVFGGGESSVGKGAGKKGSVLKGESELDQAERKRLRAARKAARRKDRKQKHADEKLISKLQPGLGLNNPYEKRKLREELQMARASGRVTDGLEDEAAADKEYQTSTKFFQKMQENVDGMLRDDDGGKAKKKRKGMEQAGQGSSVYRL